MTRRAYCTDGERDNQDTEGYDATWAGFLVRSDEGNERTHNQSGDEAADVSCIVGGAARSGSKD